MAANKFATMVHRNTNRITLILIYAVLEWTLIALLLLNSVFSYLIIKFADYVGLKPPCLWCSRLDHLFDHSGNGKNLHRDLLCEAHAAEVSRLGFCSNHQKLAEYRNFCEDCSSSRPEARAKNVAFLPWINEEEGSKCSCCGVEMEMEMEMEMERHLYNSSYILVKPSWDVLECSDEKANLITEIQPDGFAKRGSDFENGYDSERQMLCDFGEGVVVMEEEHEDGSEFLPISGVREMEGQIVEQSVKVEKKDQSVQVCFEEGESNGMLPHQHLEFFFDYSGNRLVSIDMIDSTTDEDQMVYTNRDEEYGHQEPSLEMAEENAGIEFVPAEQKIEEDPRYAVLESMEMEEDDSSWVFQAVESHVVREASFPGGEETGNDYSQAVPVAEEEEKHSALEDVTQIPVNETDAEVSIGTEIPDLDAADDIHVQEDMISFEYNEKDPSTSPTSLCHDSDYGDNVVGEQTLEMQTLTTHLDELENGNQFSYCPDLNGIEEDKVPDTPTSGNSLQSLHKKLMMLEKRDSGTEDSLDGSITSDVEGADGFVTPDSFKKALRSERKALQALYSELEEERSASAIAANQTMAMINRLQEEKAQMQMEALQYQRMMEEQSEYDQEALQLLNELMMKREREKQELEKEVEIYRRKMVEYETREKLRMLRKSKDGGSARSGFSSASFSNGEESDGLSIDLNQDPKALEEEGFFSNTPLDGVMSLEESLADFEDERMSILEQLKVLEEKLVSLDYEGNCHFEDIRPFELQNGHHGEMNGHANGFSKEMHHHESKTSALKGRNLLPIFDAVSDAEANGHGNGNGSCDTNGVHDKDMKALEVDYKNSAIDEEVEHLYERLQALEADREFLKHCISSLKKGDKGMDLLQEILQHLRDLRNVEQRARNFSDGCS